MKKNMVHAMIDIETLGTRPGSVVFQIGAVCFNPHEERFPVYNEEPKKFLDLYIDIEASYEGGFTEDKDTVDWWASTPAQQKLFEVLSKHEDRTACETALDRLSDFIKTNRVGPVWAQGASFDIPLIEEYYRVYMKPIPWKFWDVYDARTIFNFYGKKVERSGTAHNALDDAIDQARSLQKLVLQRNASLDDYRKLKKGGK